MTYRYDNFDQIKADQINTGNNRRYQKRYFAFAALLLLIVSGTTIYLTLNKPSSSAHYSVDASAVEENGDFSQNNENEDMRLPLEPSVAGAENQSQRENQSGFDLLKEEPELERECETLEIFTIGEKRDSEIDHPANDFNWVGAFDVVPDYSNPFLVGESDNSSFPWRTDSNNPDTMKTSIGFDYQGQQSSAEFTMSWSPGRNGSAKKAVYLNGSLIEKTPLREGDFTADSWENMPFFTEEVSLQLESGKNYLDIEHLSSTDTAGIWDYLELVVNGCDL